MPITIAFDNGTVCHARQDPAFGWYSVEGCSVHLGDRLVLMGIEREVVLTVDLPRATAIFFLPDFSEPRCGPCGQKADPPDADRCRTHCEFWGQYAGKR